MSGYLLDTNIISDLVRNPEGSAASYIERLDSKKICTSIVVAAELRYGCARKDSVKLTSRVESILEIIPVLPLDIHSDREYGRIRAELESRGQPIGLNDLMIGAHALSRQMVLVTDNVREFERISGLTIENWLER